MNGPVILLAETGLPIVAVLMALGLIGLMVLLAFVLILYYKAFYRKVDQGQALIVNTMKATPLVTFTGCSVIPVIHRAEVMDISARAIAIDCRGSDGLVCRDHVRADIAAVFHVRVNRTVEDVLIVASTVGAKRASDQETLVTLFQAKFTEALKTVAKQMDFVELHDERQRFKEEVIAVIGRDLHGYLLDDIAIGHLEQTPIELLDPENVFDAVGIEKIVGLAEEHRKRTNLIRHEADKAVKKQDVAAREILRAMEREQEEAEAAHVRDLARIRACAATGNTSVPAAAKGDHGLQLQGDTVAPPRDHGAWLDERVAAAASSTLSTSEPRTEEHP